MSRETEYGSLLRAARQAAGMTQKELAERMGITNVYVCDLEHGRRAPLPYDSTVELAEALKTDADPLLIAMVKEGGLRVDFPQATSEQLMLLIVVVGALERFAPGQAMHLISRIEAMELKG